MSKKGIGSLSKLIVIVASPYIAIYHTGYGRFRKFSDALIIVTKKMVAVKRVAVIGAGPAGAITIDALAKEKTFDLVRAFERREAPGGCW